jgi:hypothetical protein
VSSGDTIGNVNLAPILEQHKSVHYFAYFTSIAYFFSSFPPHWGGFISFFTLQLQIAILRLLMLLVVLGW